MLLGAEGFDVAADVSDGESAVAAVQREHPDVVLLDVQLPGMDGFEVARQLATIPDPPTVVLTSSRQASDYGSRLREAPVRAFVPKQQLSGSALAAALTAA